MSYVVLGPTEEDLYKRRWWEGSPRGLPLGGLFPLCQLPPLLAGHRTDTIGLSYDSDFPKVRWGRSPYCGVAYAGGAPSLTPCAPRPPPQAVTPRPSEPGAGLHARQSRFNTGLPARRPPQKRCAVGRVPPPPLRLTEPPTDRKAVSKETIWTTPNLITLSRIACSPILSWLILEGYYQEATAG